MANKDNQVVLDFLIKPLLKYLNLPDLVELSVVRPQEVMLEIAGVGYLSPQAAPELNLKFWQNFLQVLANLNNVPFDGYKLPILNATLPGGHRLQAMLGSHSKSGIAVSIRMRREIALDFAMFHIPLEIQQQITDAVRSQQIILISGPMSSGKTTLFKFLIGLLPKELRVQSVEDTFELEIPQLNTDNYIVDRNSNDQSVGYSHVIDHIVRMRPDVILAGEICIENTFPILRLLNLGHGFMCTIHANTPQQALYSAIPQNVQMAGFGKIDVEKTLLETIDLVIQTKRQGQLRGVSEIYWPKLNKSWCNPKFKLTQEAICANI